MSTETAQSDFKEVLLNHDYVDKTLFIKDFLDNPAIYLITRPRGWGKSLNLNMLKRFLQVEVDVQGTPKWYNTDGILFKGGCIDVGPNETKCLNKSKLMEYHPQLVQKHQGKYPVIHFSFKDLIPDKIKGPRSLKQKVSDGIRRLFNNYPFLKTEYIDKNITFYGCNLETLRKYFEGNIVIDPTLALPRLVTMLKEHFKAQVYVLLDDYDDPLVDAYKTFGTAKKYEYRLIRSMVKNICWFLSKEKAFLKGVLMGVLRIPWDEDVTDFNNITVHDTMMDNRFSAHFGFNRQEVSSLLAMKSYQNDIEDLTHLYNGYIIDGQSMYNPFSIVRYLRNQGELRFYWEDENLALIKKISFPESIKLQLSEMMESNTNATVALTNVVDFKHIERSDEIYTILHFCGYLKAVPEHPGSFNASVSFANEEVKKLISEIFPF